MSASTINTVLVIGAGTMGIGIAQIAAQSGQSVLLYDANAETPVKAKLKHWHWLRLSQH